MALAWAVGLFGAAVAIHLVIWRLFRPLHQYVTLLAIFLAALAGASAVTLPPSTGAGAWFLNSGLDYLTFAALYMALALAYTSTFSAVQADSPSMLLLMLISSAGERGAAAADLQAQLGDDVLIAPRLEDLVTGGLVVCSGRRYVIQPIGAALAGIHMWYRALLRMPKGG